MKNILFTVVLSVITMLSLGQSVTSRNEVQKLASMIQIIEYAYVDTVNISELVETTIESTLKELDPHSAYLNKEEVEKANEPLEGSFEGIGVTFQIFQDTILIVAPVPGGPSEKLGIMAGDKIVKINGENSTGKEIDNEYVMERLRGPKGSTVSVSIFRKGRKDFLEYKIVRDKIPLNSIDANFMAAPEIGYIRLNRFSKTSLEEFEESLAKLNEQGMKKLILDLRGNSGGYLGTAVDLSDEFLGMDKLIVYTEGVKSPRQDYKSTLLGSFEQGDLVIMINEGSASASEIVAGAVQDWDRGLIVGRRSFGKGLVQRPFPLSDGSMIRLTTARYYTPSGRCIQRPYENGSDDYELEMKRRFDHGEMVHADSIHFPDSLKYSTKKGRTVYGGGGVMPDVFFAWDSTWYSDYYSDLMRAGVFNKYTISYVDSKRNELMGKYSSVEEYIDGFDFSPQIKEEFLELAEKEGVKFDEKGWEASGRTIEAQVKALIARNIWDINAYYQVIYEIDKELQRTVELLQEGQIFSQFSLGG